MLPVAQAIAFEFATKLTEFLANIASKFDPRIVSFVDVEATLLVGNTEVATVIGETTFAMLTGPTVVPPTDTEVAIVVPVAIAVKSTEQIN